MPRKRHQNMTKCLVCCMGSRLLSDDEDFDDIRHALPASDRVIEVCAVGQTARPDISTGFLPEVPVAKDDELTASDLTASEMTPGDSPMTDDASVAESRRKVAIGSRASRLSDGDAAPSSDDEEVPQKIVHFALCHDNERKDTRDFFRNTPMKEKRCPVPCLEEFFIIRRRDNGNVIRVPMDKLKQCVEDYVRDIVEWAMRAISEDDRKSKARGVTTLAGDAPTEDDVASWSSDDGVELDSAEENDLVDHMVDGIIGVVVRQLKEERQVALRSEEEAPESPTEGSVSDVSAIASDEPPQLDSCTSLEWDGYEPILREDPSYTDITIRRVEMPAATADVL